jgi:multiple sugar transport system permease protein
MKNKKWRGFSFVLPSLAGIAVFVLIPFLDVVRRSFTEVVHGTFTGLTNYRRTFSNEAFLLALRNTVRFELFCIPILLAVSFGTALLLAKQARASLAKSCMLIPLAVPVASVVLLWRVIFHEQGVLNRFLAFLGVGQTDWMNSEYAFWVLVFSYIWKNLGYNVILWTAGLAQIPPVLYETAWMDGAGPWQCLWKITLPSLLPSLFTITVLSILNSFKVFREAYLVAGDYPNESMYLLQHLFNNWFLNMSLDKMAAASVVCAGTIFILVLLLKKAWSVQK